MPNEAKKPPIIGIIAGVLLLILIVGVVAFLRSVRVTGSATLKDGSRVSISVAGLGFSVGEVNGQTEIEAGSYVVRFDDDRNVNVNGIDVATLADDSKDYQLVINAAGLKLTSGDDVVADFCAWASAQDPALPVLIFASSDPDEVAAIQQRHGAERAGALVESAFGGIARELSENGFRRLVIAGGEPSGAVVSALGVSSLRIGPQIDPGVPWTESLGGAPLALALKSGNFGGPDFFARAFGALRLEAAP